MAIHAYFSICLVSRQFIMHGDSQAASIYNMVDLYFPFMTVLQFIFYVGWLKVAEALLNPFGEDDDDFECNYIIDRNIAISMCLAEKCYAQIPEQYRDTFDPVNRPLYSEEAAVLPVNPLVGSAINQLPAEEEVENVKMVPHINVSHDTDSTAETASMRSATQWFTRQVREQIIRRTKRRTKSFCANDGTDIAQRKGSLQRQPKLEKSETTDCSYVNTLFVPSISDVAARQPGFYLSDEFDPWHDGDNASKKSSSNTLNR
ncbi:Protein BEST-24 [Aphelenchoides avenae]|nr:Protein BEST-24 [Aphelenchus avenae]